MHTGAKRGQARALFEEIMIAQYGSEEIEDIWNRATFIERSKEFMDILVHVG
jgi:hypothetical protein